MLIVSHLFSRKTPRLERTLTRLDQNLNGPGLWIWVRTRLGALRGQGRPLQTPHLTQGLPVRTQKTSAEGRSPRRERAVPSMNP